MASSAWSRVRVCGVAFAACLALPLMVWFGAPLVVADPLPAVKARTSVQVWRDRAGRVLHYARTYNHEWRFDVPLLDVSPEVVRLMLNTEDARFYSHGGVDYRAAARALFQNLFAGRILSGASTISMQVAGMDYAPRRRSFARKFLQAAKARKMEYLHTKDEILEAYLNNIPYGGKLYGIEAAALYYFGLHAKEITVVEASVLCGIPQRPNRYRPDRDPEAVRRRQRRVLDALVHAGKMTTAEADRIFTSERLRYRDFREKAPFEKLGEAKELLFVKGILPTYDSELTAKIKRVLARRLVSVPDVKDAAAVLLDVATGETRAYVGTLDFDRKPDGQYDAARGVRSAGSTLKPFIYLEAIAGGLIGPESVLLDAPVRWGGYAPGNYDGSYRGEVSASDALSHSLNTPVIRLLAQLGERRVTAAFERRGLVCEDQIRTNGLALALGSAGYRLVDLTRAYRTLAASTNAPEQAVLGMLRTRALPGTEHAIAWKTGTSNNNCDAWCFACTPEWVLGVWFGNKSGARSPHLVGAELAAPAVAEIFELLYEGRSPPTWPSATALPRLNSPAATPARAAACRPATTTILSPGPGDYRVKFGQTNVVFTLAAEPADVCWFVDGQVVGSGGHAPTVSFVPGRHTVTAVPTSPAYPSRTVHLSVSPAE
ncbi:MAG: transglycosylase domain-containing protein [Kiritimatiellae bacterium]|nr:transglycosylase domain-containing protein [Kiritimatiellia bacterium]